MVRAKICGVCSAHDGALASRHGADYVGVILAPGRSRSRTLSEAAAIFDAAKGSLRVGVFVDASIDVMMEAAGALGLDVVQLHGDETPDVAAALLEARIAEGGRRGLRIWKAVRVRQVDEISAAAASFAGCVDGLLLEGWSAAGHGGVGARFDWDAAMDARTGLPGSLEVIVAGGLDPDNVSGVIHRLRPDVVDVSSGVESSLCRKSAERVETFIAAAHAAAC
jgi:phosphoribosylanthranilate isomerase